MAYAKRDGARAREAWRKIYAGATVVAIGAIGTTVWYGCSIYDSSLLVASSDGGSDDGPLVTDSGAPDTAPIADGGCAHAVPPPRPTTDDGSQDIEIVVALHSINFGASLDAGSLSGVGYDLDGLCTCPDPQSCKSNDTAQMHCDDVGGRDNAGGALLKELALLSGGTFSQDSLNANIASGLYGLVVRVQHYNGGANDTDVTVSIFVSNGTPAVDGGAAHAPTTWDGTDLWTLDSASVLGGTSAMLLIPNFADTKAYVANHVLVASADFPLTLGASDLVTLDFIGGFVTADITPQAGTYKLANGLLAGRWPTNKLLTSLQTLMLGGNPVCQGTQTYKDVKTRICGAADIPADITADGGSCNALSMAIQFSADPAQLGPVNMHADGTPLCPDAGPDDCF